MSLTLGTINRTGLGKAIIHVVYPEIKETNNIKSTFSFECTQNDLDKTISSIEYANKCTCTILYWRGHKIFRN